MGWLRDQAGRLLRSRWRGAKGAQNLSEEFASILMSDKPIVFDSPVIFKGDDKGNPPVTIITNRTPDGIVPPIVTNVSDVEVPRIPLPDDFDPFTPETAPDDPTPTTNGVPPPLSMVGQIIGPVGGADYTCRVWTGPVNEDPQGIITVEMLNLSPDAELPPGIYVDVTQNYKGVFDSNGKLVDLLRYNYACPNVFYGPPS